MDSLKKRTPWWLKISAKIVLSRIGIPYNFWRRLGVFQHGAMLDANYALQVYQRHHEQVRAYLPTNFTVLELGPGDSLSTALIAKSYGAAAVWLVDAGAFADQDATAYRPLQQRLGEPWASQSFTTRDELLNATRATYLTDGLESLRRLPSESIDFVFSQAVLEHVLLDEFNATLTELYRLQKPGGVSSHRVDLQDHLDHSLNSLRFSQQVWESKLFVNSGFYTNRLRASQILKACENAGFEVLSRKDDAWPVLPLARRHIHPSFADLTDDDLRIRGIDLVLRKAGFSGPAAERR